MKAPLFGATFNRLFGHGWLGAGYLFLYLPIVALIIYSFNASPLPTVWGGFTLEWYRKLASDRERAESGQLHRGLLQVLREIELRVQGLARAAAATSCWRRRSAWAIR